MTIFQPSIDQRELIDSVAGPVAEILPVARLHHGTAPGGADTLRQLAELGCLGIALDEAQGGAGLTATEEALLFERLGRQLASPALFATVLAGHLAAAAGDADAAGIAGGAVAVALAIPAPDGGVYLIDAPERPDRVLLLGEEGAALLPAAALSGRTPVDAEQWTVPIEVATLAGTVGADPAILPRARLLIAAQLAGIAAGARDMGVEYAKIREQFGRPIGSFQAVKHHGANMAMWAMAAADQTSFAAVALAAGRDDAGFQGLSALSMAIRAAKTNAAINIQIHGGMGFSDECDAHLFVKHAHVWEMIAGGTERVHRALLAEPNPLGPSTAAH